MNDPKPTKETTTATKPPAKKKARLTVADRRRIAESLGLTAVRGAVSGRWYYE